MYARIDSVHGWVSLAEVAFRVCVLPERICYQKTGLPAPVRRKSIHLRIVFFGIVKTSATSQYLNALAAERSRHWLQRRPKVVVLKQQLFSESTKTALGTHHRPGQCASTCLQNPSLRVIGDIPQHHQRQQQQQ